jgi:CHAT domain-containing protein/tetratricopeptide (TPR) repeat protein
MSSGMSASTRLADIAARGSSWFATLLLLFGAVACLVSAATRDAAAQASPTTPQVHADSLSRADRARALLGPGRFAAAESLSRAFIREDSLRGVPETLETGKIIDVLVQALWSQGRAGDPEAVELCNRAMAIKEKFSGRESEDYAASVNCLGVVYLRRGNFAAARQWLTEAVEIRERTGPGSIGLAFSLNNLASVESATGNYAAARTSTERTLQILEKTRGPEDPSVASVLNNLGILEMYVGDYAAARASLERALTIREKKLPPDHPDIAQTLVNLGAVLNTSGDYAAARAPLERALKMTEKRIGPTNPDLAPKLNNLAEALMGCGEYESAKPLYARSAAIIESAYGPGNADLALALNNLAGLYYRMGARDSALICALRAEEIARENVRITARGLSEQEALKYATTRTSALDLELSIVRRSPNADNLRKVWDSVIRGRALVFDEMAERNRTVFVAGDTALLRLNDSLGTARSELARLVTSKPPGDLQAYRRSIEESRLANERLELAVAARSAPFRAALTRNRLGYADLERALPSGWAIVAYVRYLDVSVPAATKAVAHEAVRLDSIPHYLALVLPRTGAVPIAIDLGSALTIDSLVTRWRESVLAAPKNPLDLASAESNCRSQGQVLRSHIWDPLRPVFSKTAHVFVVPDGALHTVNFGALPATHTSYLVEIGPSMHYLSTERDGIRSGEEHHGVGMLALGGPDYDHAASSSTVNAPFAIASVGAGAGSVGPPTYRGALADCADFSQMRFPQLPGSRQEVDDVTALWKSSHDATSGVSMDLTGSAAGETQLKMLGPGRQVIHLATHGFFLDPHCTRMPGSTAPAERTSAMSENPLLLSGLALAGANLRGAASSGSDDGVLTAEEIASLDLSSADLVVLSACSSGLGSVQGSEGVFGLRRAFAIAGAHSLVMTLWPVEDQAAATWMRAFYSARFVQHASTSDASRDASRRVISKLRAQGLSTHPASWGAFVTVGDWR